VVTQVIAFEGNGVLTEFGGGYDDWRRFSAQRASEQIAEKSKGGAPAAKPVASKPAQSRLSFSEIKELENLPDIIEALETRQAAINTALANPVLYRDHPEQVNPLQQKLAALTTELDQAAVRWEALELRRS